MRIPSIMLGSAIVSAFLLPRSASASVIADWTFYQTIGYSSGVPVDTTGNHNFQNGFGSPNPSFYGGNINPGDTNTGASCSFLNANNAPGNGGGFYGIANSGTMPTSNFSIDLWAYPTTNSNGLTTNGPGTIFQTDGGSAGSIDIGVDGGNFVAYVDNGTAFAGTLLGSSAYTNNTAYELTVTNIGGTTSFYVNGALQGSTTDPISATPFGNVSVGVKAGNDDYYSGAIEDLTVSTATPEPMSMSLLALGSSAGLMARRRRA